MWQMSFFFEDTLETSGWRCGGSHICQDMTLSTLKQFFSVNDSDHICSAIIKHYSASALVESCLDWRAY